MQTKFHPDYNRHIYYSNLLIDRSRYEIMRHMFNKNLGLLLPRRAYNWRHALITENLVVDVAISSASREANYLFPLYLYPDIEKGDLFHQKGSSLKKYANFKSHFEKKIKEFFEEKLVTEDIFYYIYSILYSNTYRKKFESLLKIDFPRIPFTKDFNLCSKMADLGKKLVNLHLLKSKDVDPPIVKFQGKGDNIVAKIRFNEKQKRLYFNEKQFFEGITKEIWEYKIGGYQICEKWLKDRKEKTLTFQEIKHFCKVSTALFRTIKCQKEIDKIYDQIEKDIIGFNS